MDTILEKINNFKETYQKEFGERKYRQILSKINNSTKINALIVKSKKMQIAPNHKDYIVMLNSIPYFMFSKKNTFAMGAILTLELWHNKLNLNYYYLDEYNLNRVFEALIYDCGRMKF